MSKALRCDKCGKTFSPVLIGVTDLFTTIPELYFQTKNDYENNYSHQRKHDLNFCPDCTNHFLAFMEDFENETSHLLAKNSVSDSNDYYSDDSYSRGKCAYHRNFEKCNSDCEAAEWPDESK